MEKVTVSGRSEYRRTSGAENARTWRNITKKFDEKRIRGREFSSNLPRIFSEFSCTPAKNLSTTSQKKLTGCSPAPAVWQRIVTLCLLLRRSRELTWAIWDTWTATCFCRQNQTWILYVHTSQRRAMMTENSKKEARVQSRVHPFFLSFKSLWSEESVFLSGVFFVPDFLIRLTPSKNICILFNFISIFFRSSIHLTLPEK